MYHIVKDAGSRRIPMTFTIHLFAAINYYTMVTLYLEYYTRKLQKCQCAFYTK